MAKLRKTNYLPGMMLTGVNEDADIANALGLVFRNVPSVIPLGSGATVVFSFTVSVKTKLLSRLIQAITGHVRYEVIVNATESSPGTLVSLSCTNTELDTPSLNTMRVNAAITGGTVIDVAEVATGSGGNSSSLPDSQVGGRTLAAGQKFWLRLTGVSASTAILYLLFHEYQELVEL